jgi:hypothetical protein
VSEAVGSAASRSDPASEGDRGRFVAATRGSIAGVFVNGGFRAEISGLVVVEDAFGVDGWSVASGDVVGVCWLSSARTADMDSRTALLTPRFVPVTPKMGDHWSVPSKHQASLYYCFSFCSITYST